ncbi:MAG: hypothetical protein EOS00_06895 [Mesorhizobium sp.]|nr:MAG: hypothetical protein EOS00_06895 [Mesorhizobium sp.]
MVAFALAIIVASSLTSAAFSVECQIEKPEQSVFDIVNGSGTKQGSAILIDADQGLFLTALHFLGPSSLRLKRDGEEKKFTRVLSGSNSNQLFEDWAIITTSTDELPRNAVHLVYDMPPALALADAKIINSAHSVGNISNVRWNDTIADGKECSGSGVTLLRIEDYDKGDSGSPVFSKEECGVVGLTSRFVLKSDASDAVEREVIALFEKFSANLPAGFAEKIEDKPTLEGKIAVIRELLKEQIYVKIIPAKCVVDEIIEQTFVKKDAVGVKVIEESNREEIKKIFDHMSAIDPTDVHKVDQFVRLVTKQSLSWTEIISMWNRYYDGKMTNKIKSGIFSRTIRRALDDASEAQHYGYVYTVYDRELGKQQKSTFVDDFAGDGLDYADFVNRNATWNPVGPAQGPVFGPPGLDVGGLVFAGPSAADRVKAGLELVDALKALTADDQKNERLLQVYKDASTSLLTSGVGANVATWGQKADTTAKAMVGLAEIVQMDASQTTDARPNLLKDALALRLADAGRKRLAVNDTEFIARSEQVKIRTEWSAKFTFPPFGGSISTTEERNELFRLRPMDPAYNGVDHFLAERYIDPTVQRDSPACCSDKSWSWQ